MLSPVMKVDKCSDAQPARNEITQMQTAEWKRAIEWGSLGLM